MAHKIKPDKELADVVSPLPVLPQKSKLADIPNDSEFFYCEWQNFVDKGQESKILGFSSKIIDNRVLEQLHHESRSRPASRYPWKLCTISSGQSFHI